MKQMMILTVVVAATWTGRSAGAGMDPAEVLGPFVDEKTLAVIRVDPSGVDLNVLAAMIVRMAKTDEDRTHLQVRTGAAVLFGDGNAEITVVAQFLKQAVPVLNDLS